MFNEFQKIATLICHGDTATNPKKWLSAETNYLATKIPYLDGVPLQATLLTTKIKPIALAFSLNATDVRFRTRSVLLPR